MILLKLGLKTAKASALLLKLQPISEASAHVVARWTRLKIGIFARRSTVDQVLREKGNFTIFEV